MISSPIVALHFLLPSPCKALGLDQVSCTNISTCGISGVFWITGNVFKNGVCANLITFLMRGGCSFNRIPKVLCLEKVWKLTHPTIMEFWYLCGFGRRCRMFKGSFLLTHGVYSHCPVCRPGVGCLACKICFVLFLLLLHAWAQRVTISPLTDDFQSVLLCLPKTSCNSPDSPKPAFLWLFSFENNFL